MNMFNELPNSDRLTNRIFGFTVHAVYKQVYDKKALINIPCDFQCVTMIRSVTVPVPTVCDECAMAPRWSGITSPLGRNLIHTADVVAVIFCRNSGVNWLLGSSRSGTQM